MAAVDVDRPVTRADIEAKLREIRGEAHETAGAARPYALAAGVVAAAAVVGLAYLLGRRRGKKRTTMVEVRRV
jgi:hypothetical protein